MALSQPENSTTLFPADPNEDETLAYAAQIVDSLSFSMVMQAAIELDLFEIMAKAGPGGKLCAEEIAVTLGTKNPGAPAMLDRMLRLLTNFEVLNCKVVKEENSGLSKKFYGLAPVSKYFVKDEDGVSLGPLMQMLQDKVFVESWYKLKDAILEGGVPFDKAHGVNAFEYPGKDERFNQVFNNAMYNHTIIIMKNILRCYKGFENLKQIVDVGGGLGQTLQSIVTKYPNIKGINFDLPHVVEHAKPCPGVEHVGGDMFESVPTGDAIFMKWILHDWSDEHCLKLLKNCYKSLPENGKVILVEAVVEEEPGTKMVEKAISEMDLIMMTQNPGGKERTEKEFFALATAAGFSGIELKNYVCNFWIIEFHK